MTNTNISNFRQNIFEYMSQAIDYNDIINVSTKNGNAIILSESDYNSLVESLYLSSDQKVKNEILEGKNTPLSECVSADEVNW